jgi:SAM-dependent methyltransferase
MAISPIEFAFLRAAFLNGWLPRGGHILEFGAANVTNLNVIGALESLHPQAPGIDMLVQEARALEQGGTVGREFALARLIYKAVFGYEAYTAIDLADEPHHADSVRQNLNEPFDLGRRFDVCVNNGTSEHIFNQANFYKAVHDHTRAGGIMVHWTPGLGWLDHGLYNVQPGFFVDLARDNGYDIRIACFATAQNLYPLSNRIDDAIWQKYPDLREAMICVVLHKTADAPFRIPMQGMYQKLRAAT